MTISKRPSSAPPVISKVTESPESASVAASSTTAWVFSSRPMASAEVKAGDSSLTSAMVTVMVWAAVLAVSAPSDAVTMTT